MTQHFNPRHAPAKNNPLTTILSIVLAFFVLLIILRLIGVIGGSSRPTPPQNTGFIFVSPATNTSKVAIFMSSDSSKEISSEEKMFSTDHFVRVIEGAASIRLPLGNTRISLDKQAELKYLGPTGSGETFEIQNGKAWVEQWVENLTFSLSSFSSSAEAGSIYSFYQTALSSTIYVMKGSITVTTKWSIARLGVGQKLTLMKSDLSGNNITIADKIEPIDDIYKTEDFFLEHNGNILLSSSTEIRDLSGSTLSGEKTLGAKSKKIIITSPEDESVVTTSSTTIEGSCTDIAIAKITINEKEVSLNKTAHTFVYKDFPLLQSTNDLVYRAFDADGSLITKGFITVYVSKKTGATTDPKKATVTTYPLTDKDFKITAPATNPYITKDDVVKIEGNVNKWSVKYITINDYRLTSFVKFGTRWWYFANKTTGTMNDGLNLYHIKYYGENDELLKDMLFTIVKESPSVSGELR